MRNVLYIVMGITIFFLSIVDASAYDRRVASDEISDDDFDKARDYLKKADKYRGENYRDFILYLTITSLVDKKIINSLDATVYIHFYKRKNEQEYSRDSLVQMTTGKSAGTLVLQKGSNMWFYKKGSANVIRISPAQRLLGSSSYSDVSSTNFSKFYDPIKLEKVALGDIDTYKIILKKVEIGVAYDTINLYLRQDDYRPLKSEFFTPSGRLLKIMYFRKFRPFLSGTIARELVIVDAIKKKEVTIIKTNKIERTSFPSAMFTQEGMRKF